jgi:hypothetical protein
VKAVSRYCQGGRPCRIVVRTGRRSAAPRCSFGAGQLAEQPMGARVFRVRWTRVTHPPATALGHAGASCPAAPRRGWPELVRVFRAGIHGSVVETRAASLAVGHDSRARPSPEPPAEPDQGAAGAEAPAARRARSLGARSSASAPQPGSARVSSTGADRRLRCGRAGRGHGRQLAKARARAAAAPGSGQRRGARRSS